MSCDSCVKSVSDALYSLDGITEVNANLKDQLVAVKGTGKLQRMIILLGATVVCLFPCIAEEEKHYAKRILPSRRITSSESKSGV